MNKLGQHQKPWLLSSVDFPSCNSQNAKGKALPVLLLNEYHAIKAYWEEEV
jgi:hypothetical protein